MTSPRYYFYCLCVSLSLVLSTPHPVWSIPFAAQKIIISAESPRAVDAGLTIARKGGNVADVAVGLALALSVTHPQSGSLGGGGLALVKMGGNVEALDFREVAPGAASSDFYDDKPEKSSQNGPLSVGVPGVPAGLYELHRKYGRLRWSDLFGPALDLAKGGVSVSRDMHNALKSRAKHLNSVGKSILFDKKGPKRPQDVFIQTRLLKALKLFQRRKATPFYSGVVARDIVESVKALGGVLTMEDLKNYRPRWSKPVTTSFEGHTIHLMPPPSSGGVVIATALKLIDSLNLKKHPPSSSAEAHLLGEILNRSFRGRNLLGDPDFHKNPINALLSPKYIKDMAKSIRLGKSTSIPPITPSFGQSAESSQTTHFVVMDARGNAVSLTTTLNSNFGSGIFTSAFGISLNNEMDDFTTQPGKPNQFGLVQGMSNKIVPGKRPLSSMTPTLIEKNGKIIGALGGRGGPRIISAVLQTTYRLLANNMDVDRAIQTGRVHQQFLPNKLFVETDRISPDVVAVLKRKGHNVVPKTVAKVFAVFRSENGFLEGAFDSRGEGKTSGL